MWHYQTVCTEYLHSVLFTEVSLLVLSASQDELLWEIGLNDLSLLVSFTDKMRGLKTWLSLAFQGLQEWFPHKDMMAEHHDGQKFVEGGLLW